MRIQHPVIMGVCQPSTNNPNNGRDQAKEQQLLLAVALKRIKE